MSFCPRVFIDFCVKCMLDFVPRIYLFMHFCMSSFFCFVIFCECNSSCRARLVCFFVGRKEMSDAAYGTTWHHRP